MADVTTPEVMSTEITAPATFLTLVRNAHKGWSAPLGGPEGVARLTVSLQDALKMQAEQLAGVRAAAIAEMLQTQSLSQVARALGVSKQAISRASKAPRWSDLTW